MNAAPRFTRRSISIISAVIIFVIGLFAYIDWRGGWFNAFDITPVIDHSTPRSQNGFTLASVQLPGDYTDFYGRDYTGYQYETFQDSATGCFGLWIKLPRLPKVLANDFNAGDSFDINVVTTSSQDNCQTGPDEPRVQNTHFFSISERLPNGVTFPLDWTIYRDQQGNCILLTTVPGGYSDAVKSVDISIKDDAGHSATWRITDLPVMHRAVAPPLRNSQTVDGIPMSAQAWEMGEGIGRYTMFALRPIIPPHSLDWDVAVAGQALEWEPYDYVETQPFPQTSTILGRNGIFNSPYENEDGGGIRGISGSDPYEVDHLLRLETVLHQFATGSESLTFHNVQIVTNGQPYPGAESFNVTTAETETTPSGIAVTIPVQGHQGISTPMGNLGLTLQFAGQFEPDQLPRSLLTEKYHRPISVDVAFGPPFVKFAWTSPVGDDHSYDLEMSIASVKPFHSATLKPGPITNFVVTVTQRVNLKTIPMQFVLPIGPVPPFMPSRPGDRISAVKHIPSKPNPLPLDTKQNLLVE